MSTASPSAAPGGTSNVSERQRVTVVQPFLFFGERCDEAIAYYRTTLGAELDTRMRFSESPAPTAPDMIPKGFEEKVVHAEMRIGQSTIMLSDGCSEGAKFEGFTLALTLPTEADVNRAFDARAAGGQVRMPVGKTFWWACFGMVTDEFGIGRMLTVAD